MTWIEITDRIETSSGTAEVGDKIQLPLVAARALVAGGNARYCNAPRSYQEEESTGEETDSRTDVGVHTTPDNETDDSGPEPVSVETYNFERLPRIGGQKLVDLMSYLAKTEIDTIDDLLDTDLTDLPHIGPSTADALRADLREVQDAARDAG
jgi:hypothetical protein